MDMRDLQYLYHGHVLDREWSELNLADLDYQI
jgi:hypothetical protein